MVIHPSEALSRGRRQATVAEADFGVLLARAYAGFVAELRAALAEAGFAGLNRSFGYVTRALADGPLSLRELARRLDLTSQGALKIVADMRAGGYVERSADARDRRVSQVRLTGKGRRALAAARRFHRRFEASLAREVGRKRVRQLRALLAGIAARQALGGAPLPLRPM